MFSGGLYEEFHCINIVSYLGDGLISGLKIRREHHGYEDSQYTGVWKFCSVYEIFRCLSKSRLYTQMLRIHLFSIFTVKTPQGLSVLALLGHLIVKTLTNIL